MQYAHWTMHIKLCTFPMYIALCTLHYAHCTMQGYPSPHRTLVPLQVSSSYGDSSPKNCTDNPVCILYYAHQTIDIALCT